MTPELANRARRRGDRGGAGQAKGTVGGGWGELAQLPVAAAEVAVSAAAAAAATAPGSGFGGRAGGCAVLCGPRRSSGLLGGACKNSRHVRWSEERQRSRAGGLRSERLRLGIWVWEAGRSGQEGLREVHCCASLPPVLMWGGGPAWGLPEEAGGRGGLSNTWSRIPHAFAPFLSQPAHLPGALSPPTPKRLLPGPSARVERGTACRLSLGPSPKG